MLTYLRHWGKSTFLSEWLTMPGSEAACGPETHSYELFEASELCHLAMHHIQHSTNSIILIIMKTDLQIYTKNTLNFHA